MIKQFFSILFLSVILMTSCKSSDPGMKINDLQDKVLKIKKGATIYFEYDAHPSIGLERPEYSISDEQILKLKANEMGPQDAPGESGGDSQDGKYIFEALQAGFVKLSIKQYYRRELQDSFDYQIEVAE